LERAAMATNRRNGKSAVKAADAHERLKDYLTPAEVDRLLEAAKRGRHGARDYVLLLVIYRHGLRVSEATGMRLSQLDMKTSHLSVKRLKGSLSTQQPVAGDTLRALKRYLATRKDDQPWLFVSERKLQLTRQAVAYITAEAGKRAKLGHVHPHMLRHSCGYRLAEKRTDLRTMQDFLGHRDPKHTAHYTRIAASNFEGLT
jgi:type 1 fimbriae regulatory protein FimB